MNTMVMTGVRAEASKDTNSRPDFHVRFVFKFDKFLEMAD